LKRIDPTLTGLAVEEPAGLEKLASELGVA
jgi:hypothetical protein